MVIGARCKFHSTCIRSPFHASYICISLYLTWRFRIMCRIYTFDKHRQPLQVVSLSTSKRLRNWNLGTDALARFKKAAYAEILARMTFAIVLFQCLSTSKFLLCVTQRTGCRKNFWHSKTRLWLSKEARYTRNVVQVWHIWLQWPFLPVYTKCWRHS